MGANRSILNICVLGFMPKAGGVVLGDLEKLREQRVTTTLTKIYRSLSRSAAVLPECIYAIAIRLSFRRRLESEVDVKVVLFIVSAPEALCATSTFKKRLAKAV